WQVEAFASVRDFLARPPYEGPSCLVLDVRMPKVTGLDLQETLNAAGQRLSIVFLTGYGDVGESVKAMKGGAVDFLTKPVQAQVLLEAVRRAVARTLEEQKEQTRVADIRDRIKSLTPREAEVFTLVVT